jgi:hypothetical protein
MHYLPYTNSRCLTNTPTRFGASRSHLQGVPPQRLNSEHVRWFQKLPDRVGSFAQGNEISFFDKWWEISWQAKWLLDFQGLYYADFNVGSQ